MKPELILAITLLATACVDEAADDPVDESFFDEGSKEDAFGITDGSPDALGVLQLANTIRGIDLREKVKLGPDAVREIITLRRRPGDTGYKAFQSLQALDDVKYVGAGAFSKLLTYARDNRYVSPNPFTTKCEGPAISVARLQELTANGTVSLPTGATWTRSRQCSGPLGCGAWTAPHKLGEPGNSIVEYGVVGTEILVRPRYYRSVQTELPQGYLDEIAEYKWSVRLTPGTPSVLGSVNASKYYWFGSNATSWRELTAASVTFTDSCLKAFGRLPAGNANQPEIEVIQLTQF